MLKVFLCLVYNMEAIFTDDEIANILQDMDMPTLGVSVQNILKTPRKYTDELSELYFFVSLC